MHYLPRITVLEFDLLRRVRKRLFSYRSSARQGRDDAMRRRHSAIHSIQWAETDGLILFKE